MLRRAFVLPIVSLIVLVAGSVGVSAHYVYTRDVVWEDLNGHCVFERAETSHGNGFGFVSARVEARDKIAGAEFGSDCVESWTHGKGRLATKPVLWKYVGNQPNTNNGWAVCLDYRWLFNTGSAHQLDSRDTYSDTPCGEGWYGSQGAGGRKDAAGNWNAGTMWSGSHWLPIHIPG